MDSEEEAAGQTKETLLRMTTDIVSAYVSENNIPISALQHLINDVFNTLDRLERPEAPNAPIARPKPAVPIARSIQHDHIVCLEDGKRLKMLKRYLRSRYDLSPEDYRRKWGLPADYPMVAPAYAARRSEFAKQIGLGRGVRRGK
ncbi:MAG: MucR family transcriptional regulator [Caulobacterales bacterium]